MIKSTVPLLGTLLVGSTLLAGGCSKEYTPTAEITEVRDSTEFEKKAPEMTTAERMQMPPMPEVGAVKAPEAAATPSPEASAAAPAAKPTGPRTFAAPEGDTATGYRWNLPSGWVEAPATPLRQVNLRLESNPDVELYVTMMPGDGGGLVANVNRWYQQMGQAPLSEEEVEALPKQIFLFKPATMVNLRGTFKGMGGDAKANYAMMGLVLIDDNKSAFVKMTGPEDDTKARVSDMLAFHQSIVPMTDDNVDVELKAVPTAPPEAPMPEAAPAAAASTSAGKAIPSAADLKWDAPAGWDQNPDRPMRVATFTVGTTECYISILGGMAGGLEANINRWYAQMGQPELTSEQIAALEKIEVLGEPCALVDVEGNFSGMQGESQTDARMLGIVRVSDEQSLFVKMTGPKEEVAAQVDNFKAFVTSLR